jgi:hypothetical protein
MPTGSIPFEEHVPHTVTELGLDLTPARSKTRRIVLAVVGVALVVGVFVLTRGDKVTLRNLAPGDCYRPAVSDIAASVHRAPCDRAHGGQLVGLFAHPAAKGDPFPGGGELALYGEGACATRAQSVAGRSVGDLAASGVSLRIAGPSAEQWAKGERTIGCSFASSGSSDLDHPIG